MDRNAEDTTPGRKPTSYIVQGGGFKCRAEGHIAPDCPLWEERKGGHNKERRVDYCVVEAPTGKLSHQGESFPFCFNSGAECNYPNVIISKLSGKRTTDIVVIHCMYQRFYIRDNCSRPS